jgi:hypothetical protein
MKTSILVILFASFISLSGFSQRKVEILERQKLPNIKLSYFGNSVSSGGMFGGEYMFRRKAVRNNFLRTKEHFVTLNFALFKTPNLNDNLMLNVEWLKRTRYKEGGLFTEFAIGVGYAKGISNISPPTYIRDANGNETLKKPENTYFLPTINVGLGYDFMPKQELPIKVFGRIGIYPILYHAFLYDERPKFEIGINTSLSIFKRR